MRRLPALFLFPLIVPPLYAETLLVLPFFNRTPQNNLDWIGESIAENIRDTLSAEGALLVSREDRQEAYRRLATRPYSLLTKASVIKVAEVLDAGQVIFGQFELQPDASPAEAAAAAGNETPVKSRGVLRITAQILDLKRIRSGPEFLALGAMEDLAALQTHLSWQTLRFLMPKTSPSEEEFRKRRVPVRVDAMEYYIRGLLAVNEQQQHHFFTQAARLDPRYSPPCFQLGKIHWEKKDYRATAEWLDRVSPADSSYREATFLRGAARYYLGDYVAAQSAFESIVKEVPLNEVYNNLAAAQSRRGFPEALENFKRALEGDGNDPVYLFNLGYMSWMKGDFDAAADRFRAVLQRDPDDQQATTLLGRSLQKAGPRAGDPKTEGLERLKHEFNISAFLQLRSILEGGKK
ncbi:MAG TPA: tetratricopeptide repeat protein [Bryobacteraceae bacterium]|nr:tetratricopeptide repeat protein [Bryobacteraceae bacterium]